MALACVNSRYKIFTKLVGAKQYEAQHDRRNVLGFVSAVSNGLQNKLPRWPFLSFCSAEV